MKIIFFLAPLLIITIVTCSVSRHNVSPIKKFEITGIDSIRDHYVFTAKDDSGKGQTILAEKDSVTICQPFKRFIIADSIHPTSILKSGNKKDILGMYISTINGIKIRDSGELIKIIWNCNCFTDM